MSSGNGNIWVTIVPLVILLLIMYFLLIRPQKKREKEVNTMRSGLQVGDEIVTIGGICGKIVKTKEETVVIQVGADKVKFEIMRWGVSKVIEPTNKPAATEDDDDDVVEEKKEAKKAKPKRMKKAEPVEEAPAEEPEVEAEAEEASEEATEE